MGDPPPLHPPFMFLGPSILCDWPTVKEAGIRSLCRALRSFELDVAISHYSEASGISTAQGPLGIKFSYEGFHPQIIRGACEVHIT